jgi:hypothetical protein
MFGCKPFIGGSFCKTGDRLVVIGLAGSWFWQDRPGAKWSGDATEGKWVTCMIASGIWPVVRQIRNCGWFKESQL